MADMANNNHEQFPYTVDVFNKYKKANMVDLSVFQKYYLAKTPKMTDKPDIFARPDIVARINKIIQNKNNSNSDIELFNKIRSNLNKVNNKMLIDNQDNKLHVIIDELTSLQYTNLNHFQKLSTMILEKTISENKFTLIYAKLCKELFPYYIENDNETIYFRQVLISQCQSWFAKFMAESEKTPKEKLVGLASFISHLYNNKLISSLAIKKCFDDMVAEIYKSTDIAEGITSMATLSYVSLMAENINSSNYIKNMINQIIINPNLQVKSKFALQNALDKIAVFDKKQ